MTSLSRPPRAELEARQPLARHASTCERKIHSVVGTLQRLSLRSSQCLDRVPGSQLQQAIGDLSAATEFQGLRDMNHASSSEKIRACMARNQLLSIIVTPQKMHDIRCRTPCPSLIWPKESAYFEPCRW